MMAGHQHGGGNVDTGFGSGLLQQFEFGAPFAHGRNSRLVALIALSDRPASRSSTGKACVKKP